MSWAVIESPKITIVCLLGRSTTAAAAFAFVCDPAVVSNADVSVIP